MRSVRLGLLFVCVGTLSCGGDGGGNVGGIAAGENAAAAEAANATRELLTSFDTFHQQQQSITTYDETTGQAWLDYYNDTFLPGIDTLEQRLNLLAEEETRLDALVDAQASAAPLRREKVAPVVIYIAGAASFAAIVVTWVTFKDKIVPQVQRVEREIQGGLDSGLNTAQAISQASPVIRDAGNQIFEDLGTTIATNAVLSGLSQGLNECGQIVVSAVSIASDTLGGGDTTVVGTRKRTRSAKGSGQTDNLFYLGESSDGTFNNVPFGDYDLWVFKDGFVRGNVGDVSVQTCSAPTNVPVTLARPDEFFPPDSGPITGGNLLGSCRDPSFFVCDILYGAELSRELFADACREAGNTWLNGQPCPEAGAVGACTIAAGDEFLQRTLVFYAEPELTPEEQAEEIEDQRQACLGIDPIAGGPGQWTANYVAP